MYLKKKGYNPKKSFTSDSNIVKGCKWKKKKNKEFSFK